MATPSTIPCPICKKPVPVPAADDQSVDAKRFPFCSERCSLIDLARWADEKYQIPVTEADEDDDME